MQKSQVYIRHKTPQPILKNFKQPIGNRKVRKSKSANKVGSDDDSDGASYHSSECEVPTGFQNIYRAHTKKTFDGIPDNWYSSVELLNPKTKKYKRYYKCKV